MSQLILRLDASPCGNLDGVIEEAIDCANRLGVNVCVRIDGFNVLAKPGDTGQDLVGRFHSHRLAGLHTVYTE